MNVKADHKNNLNACRTLLTAASQETEHARAAEVGSCSYKHHVDMGHLTALIANAATLITIGAMLEEGLTVLSAIETIVLHPKKGDGGEPLEKTN